MIMAINANSTAAFAGQGLNTATQTIQNLVKDLSTGVTIHTAGDNPAGMAITNGMQTTLGGLNQATQNNQNGINLIQTADGAMDQISSTLLDMRTMAVNAANAGVQNPESLNALQTELDDALASITTIATNTSFNSQPLLQGALDDDQVDPASKAVISAVTQDATKLPGGISLGSSVTATAAAPLTLARSTVAVALSGAASPLPGTTLLQGLDQNGTALTATAGKTFTVTGPDGSQTFTLYPTTTINDVVADINAYTAATGARAAFDPASGALTIESTRFGASPLSVVSQDMSGTGANVGLFESDTTGVAANTFATAAANQTMTLTYTDAGNTVRTINLVEDPTSAGGLTFTNPAGGPELVPPYSAFDPGAFQITVKDTSGGGSGSTVGIPAGSYTAIRHSNAFIQTGGEAHQVSSLDIPDMRAAALGHTANLSASNLASLQDMDTTQVFVNGNAQQALTLIDAAINEVSLARGQLGSLQAVGLQVALNDLQTSTTNLTTAQSHIRDTDMATATAAYARENIIYQSATAMLAQANQVPQTVLNLLKGN
jgi:flagellin